MNDTAERFLEIDLLSKQFAGVDAFNNVSINVKEGGYLTSIGSSGCGKLTLLNMIAGFEEATCGDIRIDEKTSRNMHPSKRVSDGGSFGEEPGTLVLTIERVEPTGSDTFVATQGGDIHFTARVKNHLEARSGDQIALVFDMSKVHFSDAISRERFE